jgi:predicted Zn-ribbon and HTH transcriptional regulator
MTLLGKPYECKDCGRGFRVDEAEERDPKCPSCESGNVSPRQSKVVLPPWVSLEPVPPGKG